jgi:hypothetical protein
MNQIITKLARLRIVRSDFDYHFMRATMVALFFIFGCQKWFDYEARALIPFISHGPLIFRLYPAFGVRGATLFLGSSEWLIGFVMFLGFGTRRRPFSVHSARVPPTWQPSRPGRPTHPNKRSAAPPVAGDELIGNIIQVIADDLRLRTHPQHIIADALETACSA